VYASFPPPIITGVPTKSKCLASSRARLGKSYPLETVKILHEMPYSSSNTYDSSTAPIHEQLP
jgi:hypothetical protein